MSQQADIIRHLRKHGTITPLAALREYGIMRLAARIGELRERGINIKTVRKTVATRNGKAVVAEYTMRKAK